MLQNKRSCACNVLLIAHMFLTMTEGIMALVYQSPSLYSYKLNTAYWALFGVNYGILVVAFLPCAYLIDAFNIHAHLRHIHACNAFEFVNFIVFWVSFILAVTSKVFGYEIQIFSSAWFRVHGSRTRHPCPSAELLFNVHWSWMLFYTV